MKSVVDNMYGKNINFLMKIINQKLFFPALIFILIFSSCVTIQDKMLSPDERASTEVIGHVNVKFISFQPLHIYLKPNMSSRVHSRLMEEARKKYPGNIEVVNITAEGSFNALGVLIPLPPFVLSMFSNLQTIRASGDVIRHTETISTSSIQKVTDAVRNVSVEIAERLPGSSTIAVLNIFSDSRNTSEYIISELEYNLVNFGKFRIVDRRQLDQIRNEQNFQLSGDVSDDSAISIGNMLGANIVITGEISGSGSSQRLIVKALDVKTAQIITMARERL